MIRKADLPTKLCMACQRPFAWRKKWKRCWEEVRFCSDKCRGAGRRSSVEARVGGSVKNGDAT